MLDSILTSGERSAWRLNPEPIGPIVDRVMDDLKAKRKGKAA